MAIIEYAAKSDIGRVRTNNEDHFAFDEKLGLYLVADGMGGHNSGEVASKMATDTVIRTFAQALERRNEPDRTQVIFGQNSPGLSDVANHLVSAIRLANQAIFEASQNYSQNYGMGTTLVSTLVLPQSYVIAWVGDSRIYLVRHNQIQQLSTDHSLVQEQVNRGLISADEAENSQFKNILTRALGTADTVEVDAAEIPAFDDDYIILCSDGLTKMVTDQQILKTVLDLKEPQEICTELLEAANQAGGRDNVTILMLHRKTENIWDKFLKAISKAS